MDIHTKVAYSVESWLPVTMTWIFTQVKYQEWFSPIILADETYGIERLPDYSVYSQYNKITRSSINLLRRIGIRPTPRVFNNALIKHQTNILHSHFGDRGWYDLPMVGKHNLKHVVSFYGYDLSFLPSIFPVWKKRYKELFDCTDLFLCEGPHMAQQLRGLGCPEEKVKVQRLGIDLEKIPFRPREVIDNGTIKILIAGRFVEKKGIPYALEAVGRIKEKYSNIRVTIVGDSAGTKREEVEKEKILEIIQRYDMQAITSMLGFQPFDVLMQQAYNHHLFLSPSVTAIDGDIEGGVPVSIIEMLASGMLVISSFHCDIPGVVFHRKSGLLAQEKDVDTIAEYIIWLIEHQEKWKEMTEAGRRHIERNFNARIQGQELIDIYQKLIQ